MISVALVGLIKIELPTQTIRWCSGGFQQWGSETFTGSDDIFGVIGSVDPLDEGITDEIPALEMVCYPTNAATPGDLSQPGFQTSRVRFWIAEYTPTTGVIVGTPDLLFDGMLDQTRFTVGKERTLAMSVVSLCERMLALNIGNSMNPNFHKSIWPGETGHDQATGLSQQVAWGTDSPPSASSSYTPAPSYGKAKKNKSQ